MTFGKVAAQLGHAALALRNQDAAAAAVARDGALEVRLAEHAVFTRASHAPGVACVHDAGLTEVAPGTVTALALAAGPRGEEFHALARPV